jgi:hypothetical protein
VREDNIDAHMETCRAVVSLANEANVAFDEEGRS